jgi:peptidoglycan-associated lipoprotein
MASKAAKPGHGDLIMTYGLRTLMSGVKIAAGVAAMLLVAACASNQTVGPDSANLSANAGAPATPGTRRDFSQNVGDIVYFTTDSSDLTPEAEQTLGKQARWLNQYAQYTITIEGHADERGTREYNIALGARRAQSVRNFLSRSGVDARRIRTLSYGKERPVAVCNDISCWSQNRRAQTILNNRGGAS